MGTTMSMDVSANIQDSTIAATATDTAPQQMTFEDKLRQELILIPEDLADIHIEAPYTNTNTNTIITIDYLSRVTLGYALNRPRNAFFSFRIP